MTIPLNIGSLRSKRPSPMEQRGSLTPQTTKQATKQHNNITKPKATVVVGIYPTLIVQHYSITRTAMTEACENAVLNFLASDPSACIEDTHPWALAHQLDPLAVRGAVNSLLSEGYVEASELTTSFYTLLDEGQSILEDGSQEMRVLKAVAASGKMSLPDLDQAVGKGVSKIGMGNCMKNKWVKKEGADLVPLKTPEEVEDTVQKALLTLRESDFAADAVDGKVGCRSFKRAVCD